MKYKILEATSSTQLEKLVETYIENGWKPIGGVSVLADTGRLIHTIGAML